MTESTELVTIPSKETALDVFKSEHGLDPYLATIRQELDAFLAEPPSLDTASGRKSYASMAHKVARSKTAIDNIGKELVADLKQLPKTIDAERKRWRDQLDAWRDEARGPLNEWEAEEEARKQEHIAFIDGIAVDQEDLDGVDSEALKLRLEYIEELQINESLEEYEAEAHRVKAATLLVLKAVLERRLKHEAEQAELERLRQEAAEREQKEREERIAREAKEAAQHEAEQKAQAEREAAQQRELEAKRQAERKEREHQEALAKAQREAEAEHQRIQQEHQRQEQARIDAERRKQEEAKQRQANKEHRASVNRAAMQAMIDDGIPEDCAKQAVELIVKGRVPGIAINY